MRDLIQSQEIEDGKNAYFAWNKEEVCSEFFELKDFALFFKRKSLQEFSDLPEFQRFERQKIKFVHWAQTFSDISDNFEPIPPYMLLEFIRAKGALLASWLDQIRNKHIYNLFLSYYEAHRESFDVERKMNFKVRTREGFKNVNLKFAENFRFKPEGDTLNLFNMRDVERDLLLPDEGHFLYVIDFRQFEFRTFLNLVDAPVDFSKENLYEQIGEMAKIENPKQELLAYLYSRRVDERIKPYIDKEKIWDNLSEDAFVWREFPVYLNPDYEDNKKLHTIIQTISYFIYLQKLAKILSLLGGKNSRILYPLHDAMIFSIEENEATIIPQISQVLEDEVYKIKQLVGENYSELERL